MKWITRERPKIDRIASPWHVARFHVVVRGVDMARLELAPQFPGLLALSRCPSSNFHEDHEQLEHGFVMYDALYSWLKHVREEKHDWNPQRNEA